MQMRTRAQYHGLRWVGIGLLLAGILLVVGGLAYYGNLYWLRSSVDDYAAQHTAAVELEATAVPRPPETGSIISPLALPPEHYADAVARLGFTPLTQSDAIPLGTLPTAQRLTIPKLGVNVKMDHESLTGAEVVNRSAKAATSATDVVQANPGERGAIWLFGEPGTGADNFGGLMKAADLLDDGDDILMFVDNGTKVYLYAVSHTDVIPASDLRLSGSGRSTIHLTVPVPPGLYDHFLVMNGELVGVK